MNLIHTRYKYLEKIYNCSYSNSNKTSYDEHPKYAITTMASFCNMIDSHQTQC